MNIPWLICLSVAGTPRVPYGMEALLSALEHFHGYYRTSTVLWLCQDWKDCASMARIYDMDRQWAHVRVDFVYIPYTCNISPCCNIRPFLSLRSELLLGIGRICTILHYKPTTFIRAKEDRPWAFNT